jgi:hypothetical protein
MMCRNATLFFAVLLLGGCDGSARLTTPTATPSASSGPATVPLPPLPNNANWIAEATVLSATGGGGCGWGRTPGDTRSGVAWRVEISGESIVLDEDMRNWPTDDVPYRGTLNGAAFTAMYDQGPDYLRWVCQFKGGTLTGTFSLDQTTFEAMETLIWGAPGSETTVRRRWSGSRLSN